MNRWSKRRTARQNAEFDLKNGLAKREAPTEVQLEHFFNEIQRGNNSAFGLIKLAKVNLDLDLLTEKYQPFWSVLGYAVLQKRDAIIGSLQRAGCSSVLFRTTKNRLEKLDEEIIHPEIIQPESSSSANDAQIDNQNTISHNNDPDEKLISVSKELMKIYFSKNANIKFSSNALVQLLGILPPGFAVHVVKLVLELKSVDNSDVICDECGELDVALKSKNCAHQFCELCFYKTLWKNRKYFDLVCPICNDPLKVCFMDRPMGVTWRDYAVFELRKRRQLPDFDEIIINMCDCLKPVDKSPDFRCFKNPDFTENLILENKINTKLKYDKLGEDTWSKKLKFKSYCQYKMKSQYLGSKSSQRLSEFEKCIVLGDILRLICVIEAGVDVDAILNDYKQNALHLAIFNGNETMAWFLINIVGIDTSICTVNGGISSYFSTARSLNDDCGMVDMLQNAGLEDRYNTETCYWDMESVNTDTLFDNQELTIAIDTHEDHPGAGTIVIDNFVDQSITDILISKIFEKQTDVGEESTKDSDAHRVCSQRRYFLDSEKFVGNLLETGLKNAIKNHHSKSSQNYKIDEIKAYQHLRFLHYDVPGGWVPPHVDLNRTDGESLEKSTHTFILYLSEPGENGGGETDLLKFIPNQGEGCEVMFSVVPKFRRLLLFPHACPHIGRPVLCPPKLLVRGEVRLSGFEKE